MAAKTAPKYAPIVQAIIDGAHDADLEMIIRGAEWRRKKVASESGIRKGATVLVADDKRRAGEFAGLTGKVVKVHKVRTAVAFACKACGSVTSVPESTSFNDRCGECYGIPAEANIPTDLLTVAS